MNATSDARDLNIHVDGATLAAQGRQVMLSAKDTQATNTLEQPTNIVPVETAARHDKAPRCTTACRPSRLKCWS